MTPAATAIRTGSAAYAGNHSAAVARVLFVATLATANEEEGCTSDVANTAPTTTSIAAALATTMSTAISNAGGDRHHRHHYCDYGYDYDYYFYHDY